MVSLLLTLNILDTSLYSELDLGPSGTFKMKLHVTWVNRAFQPLPIFVRKSSILDFAKAWIEYCNIIQNS